MKNMMIIATALLLSSGLAQAQDADDGATIPEISEKVADRLAQYEPTGETKKCLRTYYIRNSKVLDDWRILFEMRGGGVFLNTLPWRCPRLGFEKSFTYTLRGPAQLCDLDTITVLQTFGSGLNSGASCALGKFVELEKIADDAK